MSESQVCALLESLLDDDYGISIDSFNLLEEMMIHMFPNSVRIEELLDSTECSEERVFLS